MRSRGEGGDGKPICAGCALRKRALAEGGVPIRLRDLRQDPAAVIARLADGERTPVVNDQGHVVAYLTTPKEP